MLRLHWSPQSLACLVLLALSPAFPAVAASTAPRAPVPSSGSEYHAKEVTSTRDAVTPPRDLLPIAQNETSSSSQAGATPNAEKKPFSNPGYEGFLHVGDPLVLDASRSTDPYGQPLTYHWSVLSVPAGSTAKLSDPTSVQPTLAPIDAAGTYVVQLIVSDKTLSSDPATLTLVPEVDTPLAQISFSDDSYEIHVGEATQLDGSQSTDKNEAPLSYAWTLLSAPAGSRATFSSATAVEPTFTPDIYGDYKFQLIVHDRYLTSLPTVIDLITTILPPVAKAGKDQTVTVGQTVLLNGSASKDADGLPLTYSWSLLSKPAASDAVLADHYSVGSSFVVDAPGLYVAQLIVNNGFYDSVPSVVDIATYMLPPVADAGSGQIAALNHPVQLDGTASFDTTGLPLTYSWSLLSMPAGSKVALSSANTAKPTLTPDVYGIYVSQLIVSNGTYKSPPKTVAIHVVPGPIADAGPNQTVALGSTVTLTGAGSYDPSGHPLTYAWSILSAPGTKPLLTNANSSSPFFVASLAGTYTLQLVVSNGAESGVPSTVQISVVAPRLTIYPTSLSFPDEALDSISAPQRVTLLNAGTVPITLSNLLATGDFSHQLTSTCGGTLAAGALCSVSVVFSPSTLGTRTGTLSLATNVPGSPQTISLRGKSIASVATRLVFTSPPQNTAVNSPQASLTVAVEDVTGHIVTSATTAVTLTFSANPGKGLLSGTATANAVAGVATFSTLSINKVGNGYQLLAAAPALSPATSAPFNVVAGAPAQLVFLQQPTTIASRVPFSPVVSVGVEDRFGNLVDAPSVVVSLALGSTENGIGSLAGTSAVAAVHGIATFPQLTVGPTGKFGGVPHERGYFLTASSGKLPPQRSFSFDLLKPAFSFGAAPVGDNTSTRVGIAPPYPQGASPGGYYRPEQDETLTITSNDPKHFLLSFDPTKIGSASLTLPIRKSTLLDDLPQVYLEGRNFAGTKPIIGTISLNLPEFIPVTSPVTLYPSALELSTTANSTVAGVQTIDLKVSLALLNPETLQTKVPNPNSFPPETYDLILGPQVSLFSITSSNPVVGSVKASPMQFPIASFEADVAYQFTDYGTTTLHLTQPPGFSVPSDKSNSITETSAPPDGFALTLPPIGHHTVSSFSVSLLKPADSDTTVTITSSDPAHFLVGEALGGNTYGPGSKSMTLTISRGQTFPYGYGPIIYGGDYLEGAPITGVLTISAPGHTTKTAPLTLFPSTLSFGTFRSLTNCAGLSGSGLEVIQTTLVPGSSTPLSRVLRAHLVQPAGGSAAGSRASGAAISTAYFPTPFHDAFPIVSSNPGIGVSNTNPGFSDGSGITIGIDFVPLNVGKTTLTLIEPRGFAPAGNFSTQINATVVPQTGPGFCDLP